MMQLAITAGIYFQQRNDNVISHVSSGPGGIISPVVHISIGRESFV